MSVLIPHCPLTLSLTLLSFCLFVRHCINSDLFASRITLYVTETWPAASKCLLTLTLLVPRLCITLPPLGISFPLHHSISWSCILCLWTVFFYPAVGLDSYSHVSELMTMVAITARVLSSSHSLLGYILRTIRKENAERIYDNYASQVHSTVWGHFYINTVQLAQMTPRRDPSKKRGRYSETSPIARARSRSK